MSEFLLKKNVFALITIIIFCIIKLYIDFFVKTDSWRFSNSFSTSATNSTHANTDISFYIKILNNFLTIMVLGIVTVYLFAFDLAEKDPKMSSEISIPPDSAVYEPIQQKTAEVVSVQFINTKPLETVAIAKKSTFNKTNKGDKKLMSTSELPGVQNINIKPVDTTAIVADSLFTKTKKRDKKHGNTEAVAKNNETSAIEDKELAAEEMDSILNIVNTTRKELGIQSKCIQVIKTRGSNVKNAFDLAKFFKKNGYVIAGRELKSEKVEGFKILVSGIIIKVTVGTYPRQVQQIQETLQQ